MKIIESIQYAPADQIVSWFQKKDTVQVQPNLPWILFPIYVASGDMTTSDKNDKAGKLYTVNISARLKEEVNIKELVIIKVNLCDGSSLIIGAPNIPVDLNQSSTLYLSTLSISYTGINPPLKYTV